MTTPLPILCGLYFIIQLLPFSFLFQPTLLLLIYGIEKLGGYKAPVAPGGPPVKNFQFGIIITAHRETTFIPPIVDSLLKQTYPYFNVYIVADDCDTSRLNFPDPRIHLLPTPRPLNDQVTSLEYGSRHLAPTDQVVVIFDPDNLIHPDFFLKLNSWYNRGFLAVQGSLHSKNKSALYARLDTMGMSFGFFMDREIRSMLGLSVNIWGCGISIHKEVYQEIIYDAKSATGGFDKHLQIEIARRVRRIAFAPDAIVYDEKVEDGNNFERQRIRWIAAYFKFLGKALGLLWQGIRRLDGNLIYFSYNLLRPPYFLLVICALTFSVTDWLITPAIGKAWLLTLLLFAVSFLIIVTKDTRERSAAKAVWYLPLVMYHQLRAFLRLRLSRKTLLKTEHTRVVYIDEVL